MRGKRFSIGAWVFSLAGVIAGAFLISPRDWKTVSSSGESILWSGGFFVTIFIGGFLGLNLWMALNRKYQFQRPKGWLPAFLLSGLLLFGAGAAGQALFMYSKEEVTFSVAADMVLLLDASGSMAAEGYTVPRTEAACQFVDSLEEECRLSAIAFASSVLDSSQLAVMDVQGKTGTKDFICSFDSDGSTDFDAPLRAAMELLESQGRAACRRAVFLLTDGEGDLFDDVIDDYLDSDIMVFTIRIDSSGINSGRAQALARFAADTGGFDTQLKPDADGSVDTAAMLEAFQNAFQASTETSVMRGELLFAGGKITAYQFFIRLTALSVCAVLFGIGYFGRLQRPAVFYHLLCGAVLNILMYFCGVKEYEFNILLVCVLMASVFMRVDLDG